MRRLFDEDNTRSLRARKFLMWLFVISSFMFFAALTSAFIIYTAGSADRGLKILLPHIFKLSTGVVILSSITMHLSYLAAKRLKFIQQRRYLISTILLGMLFFVLQLFAWQMLVRQGVYFVNYNASQSFLYIFTGAHLLHIIFGVCILIYTLVGILKNIAQERTIFRLEVASIFWHFIDILWIYLYVFLLLGQ